MPKLIENMTAVAPGEIYPRVFEAGTEVEGRLAEIAESMGKLEKRKGRSPAMKAIEGAPENK